MTIYDIAKEAGVSVSSVSRVLNNRSGIGEEKRKQIQQILDKYDYSPNAAARGLVMQSTKTIGVLMEDIRSSHHAASVYALEQELMKHEYTCMTFSTGHDPERKASFIKLLESKRVEGVILIGSMFAVPEVREAVAKYLPDTPVVIQNGYFDLPNVYGVLADEERGIEDCVQRLLSKGKQHPALLLETDSPAAINKKNGFLREMLAVRRKEPIVILDIPEASGRELTILHGRAMTAQLLEEHPETDSIIYSDDYLAIGGILELRERKRKIPKEIAVIGVDNTLAGQIVSPSLTTLDNKLVELSENAVSLLMKVLKGEKVSKRILLPTDIIEREST